MCIILIDVHLCGIRGDEISRENCHETNEAEVLLISLNGHMPTTEQIHQLANLREQCADMTEERDILRSEPTCRPCREVMTRLGRQECYRRIQESGEVGSRWVGYGR